MKKKILLIFILSTFIIFAKVDIVTLPSRDKVQLTIYNSADLTLVRDERILTLKRGENSLQFSWANTLIDPTSLELLPKQEITQINISQLIFPPRVNELGIWKIDSKISRKVPFEISYFTSGISWEAFYIGTVSNDEKSMELKGYVKVINRSGEDYENASVRLVVGKINLLEQIRILAQKFPPYGKPGYLPPIMVDKEKVEMFKAARAVLAEAKEKEIIKEGVSEYFLYTIEGTESLPDKWSKRLLSFSQKDIPIEFFYKYEEEKYGEKVRRFIKFANDQNYKLGKEPLPDGLIKIFKYVNNEENLSYIGSDKTRYIPIGEKIELNLGESKEIKVDVKSIDTKTKNYMFNKDGNISGWEEEKTYKIKVINYKNLPVKVEIKRNFPHQYWKIDIDKNIQWEKYDLNSVKFSLNLSPLETKEFTYKLILFEGDRRY
ncbi:MAG: DUF4139 domain-containing protein [Candidatus Omnitrophica bacterium]|nr:DUF4139 domain-containing protein [Candidatus Omnitrophota bacterium]MCM8802261.1 DUF4139 domain-containing protein [Candidatus Omnitrophota bacterium]